MNTTHLVCNMNEQMTKRVDNKHFEQTAQAGMLNAINRIVCMGRVMRLQHN